MDKLKALKTLLLMAVMLAGLVAVAQAGQLRNTFTSPAFEASITGPDTCAAGTVPQATTMTIRRRWTGPQTGQDSLTNVLPNLACVMTAGVPNGTYTVTVDARDLAGNWNCPTTAMFLVKGKPARINNLGDAMMHPEKLPTMLLAYMEE